MHSICKDAVRCRDARWSSWVESRLVVLGLSHLRSQIGFGELVVVQGTGRGFSMFTWELAPMRGQTAGLPVWGS